MSETWWEYVQRISARASQKQIAADTGIERSSINRWSRGGGTPRGEAVVAMARAYHRPPMEAFVAAGYIREEETGGVARIANSISELPTEDLLIELRRRTADWEINRR